MMTAVQMRERANDYFRRARTEINDQYREMLIDLAIDFDTIALSLEAWENGEVPLSRIRGTNGILGAAYWTSSGLNFTLSSVFAELLLVWPCGSVDTKPIWGRDLSLVAFAAQYRIDPVSLAGTSRQEPSVSELATNGNFAPTSIARRRLLALRSAAARLYNAVH